jgi:hypothetical protein
MNNEFHICISAQSLALDYNQFCELNRRNSNSSLTYSESSLKCLELLFHRINVAEKKIDEIMKMRNCEISRVKQDLMKLSVYSARFVTVPADYYDRSMEERSKLLSCNVSQMCKSIIFENTACNHGDCSDPTNSRYYCVIVQYAGNSIQLKTTCFKFLYN